MSLPNQITAYPVELDHLQRAWESEKGIRIPCGEREQDAKTLRFRLVQARALHRKENYEAYPKGHVLHGKSEYDTLITRLRFDDGKWYVYIEKRGAEFVEYEELT